MLPILGAILCLLLLLLFIIRANRIEYISGGGFIREVKERKKTLEELSNEIINYYSNKYPLFAEWKETIDRGASNEYLEAYFSNYGKSRNTGIIFKQNANTMKNYIIYGREIGDYFNFKEKLYGKRFFDIGFAPGGMSYYLLRYCDCRGDAITLDPNLGGNPIFDEIEKFVQEKKYNYKLIDLLTLSMQEILNISNLGFSPDYDFVIFDASKHRDEDNAIALNNLQAVMALSMLKDGGSVLTRLRIDIISGLDRICFFINYFEKYSGFKPLIKFAYKKSFYAYFENFNKKKFETLKQTLTIFEDFSDNLTIGEEITMEDTIEKSDKVMKIWDNPMRTHISVLNDIMKGKKLSLISNKPGAPKNKNEMVSLFLNTLKKYNVQYNIMNQRR